jgi:hypothetical protein
VSSTSSTAARAVTGSPASSSTASAANCANATAKARRISSAPLGLVVNAIILWNTIYMDAALDQLRAEGFDVRDEDVARLSPLSRPAAERYRQGSPERSDRGR